MKFTLSGLLFSTFLLGCASGPKKVDPATPIKTTYGFEFKIPMSGEWYVGPATDTFFIFGKKTQGVDTSILAEVRQDRVNFYGKTFKNNKQVLENFQKSLIEDASGGRIKNTRSDFKQKKFKGADCLFFNQLGEDLEARGTSQPHMQISFKGILCIHPKDQSKYIRLAISQRVGMKAQFVSMEKDEEAFYNSMEFQ